MVSLFLLLIFGSHSYAVTDIASNAEIVTDQNTVKEIWRDIFSRYDRLSSRHLFSKIVVNQEMGTAEVTCTVPFLGASVLTQNEKTKPMHIDFWFEAIHLISFFDGENEFVTNRSIRNLMIFFIQ